MIKLWQDLADLTKILGLRQNRGKIVRSWYDLAKISLKSCYDLAKFVNLGLFKLFIQGLSSI